MKSENNLQYNEYCPNVDFSVLWLIRLFPTRIYTYDFSVHSMIMVYNDDSSFLTPRVTKTMSD